jgi:CRP-like cAMP-binding protein
LTPGQLSRLATHGRRRRIERGEVLQGSGQPPARLVVVITGTIEVVTGRAEGGQIAWTFEPGTFDWR